MTIDEYELLRSKAKKIKELLERYIEENESYFFSEQKEELEDIITLSNDIINTENNYPLGG